MASYFLAPIGNDSPFFLSTGVAASGAKLFTYTAGSTTKTNTYQDNAGNTLNANPILLNSSGYPASGGSVVEIWLISGTNYKFVLAPSTDSDPPASPYWTRDNISGVNDVVATASEWVAGPTPTFISATQFSLVGDQTGTFQVGRRIKTTNTAGTIYSYITVSAFTSLTTVTVVNDSGTLDSGLSAVSYGLLSSTNPSYPGAKRQTRTVLTSGSAATYTTPLGATRINVRMVGGGGGGGAVATNAGTNGNNTTFGTLTASGGTGGTVAGGGPVAGGAASGGDINLAGGTGGTGGQNSVANVFIPGGNGGNSAFGGGGGGGIGAAGGNGVANTGGGGGGGGGASATNSGGGGGSGGYVEKLITGPSATYTYTVGAAANGGTAGTQAGGNGAAGIIIVDEYYN